MKTTLKQIITRVRTKEINKAWERSWTRRGLIAAMIYSSAMLFLWIIKVPDPYFAALVPVGGFLLSTATLAPVKKWWIKNYSAK